MLIVVFDNSSSSYNNGIKVYTFFFVQKLYFRTNYIEYIVKEDIDMKYQNGDENLKDPINIREAASEKFVDFFNDPSVIKNTGHVNCKNYNLDKVGFVRITSIPAVGEPLTAKFYVDTAISNSVEESFLLKLDPDEK